MSDAMSFFDVVFAVIMAVEAWPAFLLLTVVAIATAVATRGAWRVVAGFLACVFALDVAFAGGWWFEHRGSHGAAHAQEDSTHSTLDTVLVVDGLELPAGTEVTWTDPSHAHIKDASLSAPANLLGVSSALISRDTLGWTATLAKPQPVDGWTCEGNFAELWPDGRPRRCTLSTGRNWNGWPIPAGTRLETCQDDKLVRLYLPEGHPVMAQAIGRPLPTSSTVTMNPDGSLDSLLVDLDSPVVVRGVPLYGDVSWHYAPQSARQGPPRSPIAVSGTVSSDVLHRGHRIAAGSDVTVRLTDGNVTTH